MYGSSLSKSRIGIVFLQVSVEVYGCSSDTTFATANAKVSMSNKSDGPGMVCTGYLNVNEGDIRYSLVFKFPQNSLAHFLIW